MALTLDHIDGSVWEIAVPSGTYTVHLVAGDPSNIDSVYKIQAEGVVVVSGTPTASTHWFEGTVTVTVSDGRLTVTPAGGNNNKIDYIDITSTAQNPPAAPTNLAATPGLNQVALSWTAAAGVSYRLQYNTNLAGTNWTAVAGDVLAGGSTASKTDSPATNAARFYRVLQLP